MFFIKLIFADWMSLCAYMFVSTTLTAGLLAFLFGLVAVVLVLLVLFPPVDGLVPLGMCVLGGVTWYSGSSIGSSSQLPASATKEYG